MPATSMPRRVLVVGGGVGGLATAIALRRQGFDCEVVELHERPPVVGVGLTLLGPTLRALGNLGLLDAAIERGWSMDELLFCDAAGTIVETVALPRLNGPAYPGQAGMLRPELHEILTGAVHDAGATIRRGLTVSALREAGEGVDVAFSDGGSDTYDLVVGADGIRSAVRAMVFGDQLQPEFRGQAVCRAVLDRPPDVTRYHLFYGPRTKAGINPVSQHKLYVLLVQNVPDATRPPQERLPEILRELLADYGGPLTDLAPQIRDPAAVDYRPL